jgi:hypothetical protein
MPHDIDGKLIEVGDRVVMAFVVKSVSTGEEYCNLGLESVERLWPGEHTTYLGEVNAKQVRRVDHE